MIPLDLQIMSELYTRRLIDKSKADIIISLNKSNHELMEKLVVGLQLADREKVMEIKARILQWEPMIIEADSTDPLLGTQIPKETAQRYGVALVGETKTGEWIILAHNPRDEPVQKYIQGLNKGKNKVYVTLYFALEKVWDHIYAEKPMQKFQTPVIKKIPDKLPLAGFSPHKPHTEEPHADKNSCHNPIKVEIKLKDTGEVNLKSVHDKLLDRKILADKRETVRKSMANFSFRAESSIIDRNGHSERLANVERREIFRASLFYPETVFPGETQKIIAYGHTDRQVQEVLSQALQRFEPEYKAPLKRPFIPPKYCLVTVTPQIPGLEFDPPEAKTSLWEDIRCMEFFFKPFPSSSGKLCRGWFHFWLEGLILTSIPVTVSVEKKPLLTQGTPDTHNRLHPVPVKIHQEINKIPYLTIYPCYSPQDTAVEESLRVYTASFHDDFIMHVRDSRTKEKIQDVEQFVKKSDIFQIFWSEKLKNSKFAQQEWHLALKEQNQRKSPLFVITGVWQPKYPPLPREICPTPPPPRIYV